MDLQHRPYQLQLLLHLHHLQEPLLHQSWVLHQSNLIAALAEHLLHLLHASLLLDYLTFVILSFQFPLFLIDFILLIIYRSIEEIK